MIKMLCFKISYVMDTFVTEFVKFTSVRFMTVTCPVAQ
jgi:hypothetical protein